MDVREFRFLIYSVNKLLADGKSSVRTKIGTANADDVPPDPTTTEEMLPPCNTQGIPAVSSLPFRSVASKALPQMVS